MLLCIPLLISAELITRGNILISDVYTISDVKKRIIMNEMVKFLPESFMVSVPNTVKENSIKRRKVMQAKK